MKIGSQIPIATGSYQTGAATALVSSLVNTQFQYQDVGVNIEMTPSVHYDHDVTLKIKITVCAESGTVTISGVTEPIITPARRRSGHPPPRGRGQHPRRHPEQPGAAQLDRHPRPQRHSHPQVHLRLQGPHHPERRDRLRRGAAHRALAGTRSGQPARHRHRLGPVHRPAPRRHGRSNSAPVAPAQLAASRAQPAVGTDSRAERDRSRPAMLAQLRSDMASNGGPDSTAQAAATAPNPASQAASQAVAPPPAPPAAARCQSRRLQPPPSCSAGHTAAASQHSGRITRGRWLRQRLPLRRRLRAQCAARSTCRRRHLPGSGRV